jgi:hypothetical protein
VAGKVDLQGARAWVCVDEGDPGNRQRVNVMLRPCPAPCGAADRDRLDTEWFEEDLPGARTAYLETSDHDGRYALHLSHFFAGSPEAAPRRQVGVSAFAPPASRAAVQKVANDIFTQTP